MTLPIIKEASDETYSHLARIAKCWDNFFNKVVNDEIVDSLSTDEMSTDLEVDNNA